MLKPSLQLKLGQSLTMTPQLQQAIRLLQLPVLDLSAQIQDALEENIMLEMEDLPDVPQTNAETTAEVETIQAEDTWQQQSAERIQDGGWNGEGRPFNDFADESGQTLREHLLWQLEMENLGPREEVIGEAIIDSIDDDGYLTPVAEGDTVVRVEADNGLEAELRVIPHGVGLVAGELGSQEVEKPDLLVTGELVLQRRFEDVLVVVDASLQLVVVVDDLPLDSKKFRVEFVSETCTYQPSHEPEPAQVIPRSLWTV